MESLAPYQPWAGVALYIVAGIISLIPFLLMQGPDRNGGASTNIGKGFVAILLISMCCITIPGELFILVCYIVGWFFSIFESNSDQEGF
jgi:hypothetical protein